MPRSSFKVKVAYIVFFASILVVVIGAQLVIQYGLDQQNDDAKNISFAARQIMISQRISKLALYIERAELAGNASVRSMHLDTLKELSEQWKHEYYSLIIGAGSGRNTPRIDAMLRENALRLDTILVACNAMIQNPYSLTISNSIKKIAAMELPFLLKMEEVVRAYKDEAEQKLSSIKRIEIILATVTLAILGCEFFFIFFPLIRQQYNDNKKLKHITEELTVSNQKLAESEKKFRLISENATDLISLTTLDGQYLYVSPSAKSFCGYEPHELLNINRLSLIHPDDLKIMAKQHGLRDRLLNGESVMNLEVRFKHKEGHYIWVETNVQPLAGDDQEINTLQTISRNITQRKETEAALEAAKEKAEKATQAKSEFLSSMTHEIRTPLNGVIGFVDLLKGTQLDEMQKQYISIISQSANGLLDVINDILDFSKIEAGKLTLAPEKINLHELGKQVTDMVSFQAKIKDLNLKFSISSEVHSFIWADAIRLRQVLINLMGNAIKFTEQGEVKLTIAPLSSIENATQRLRFTVSDTGIGIKPENQEKIFQAFSQEDASITKKFGGTGLGLTISNTLLALMGSYLQLSSNPVQGSNFYFDISFKLMDHHHLTTQQSAETMNSSTVTNQKMRILIAEDNDVNMMLLKIMLENIFPDVELIEASNGKIAVEQFHKNKHQLNLVFMDIQMPEMNGYHAATQIRKTPDDRHIPIIALTAGTVKGEKERCLEAGMDDYVSKPIIQDSLKAVLNKWLIHKSGMEH